MINKKNILVTGADGQLGRELQAIAPSYSNYRFLFTDKTQLAIEDTSAVKKYFSFQQIDHCINCAAYTAVDNAETEKEKAFLINGVATGELAKVCQQYNTQLIHISTDYVFDGTAVTPYKESDPTSPVNSYGESKLMGEQLAMQNDPSTIIIRTSWMYSAYGNNFVKTMLRLMKEKESINVVNDQYGCPTYAADLAAAIMVIIDNLDSRQAAKQQGVFNYCNSGPINWFEFANAIKELSGSNCIVNPVPTLQYPTAAKRPQYTVLDTKKIRDTFNVSIPDWKLSLEKCLLQLATG